VEQQAKGAPEKTRDAGIGSLRGTVTPEIKTIFSSTNTNLVVVPGWITI
jgi:hypothetical protein